MRNFSCLGKIVFNDSKKRLKLNQITHPFVLDELESQLDKLKEQGTKIIILDIPLLYESKLDVYTDITMLVYLDHDTQVKRLMKRDNIDNDLANKKIISQLAMGIKKKIADVIIDNNNSIEETNLQLEEIYESLRSDEIVN
jgi:dephospho-CoA kinase